MTVRGLHGPVRALCATAVLACAAAPHGARAGDVAAQPAAPAVPVAQTAAASARARLQYLQFCVGCHGMDGRGAPGKGVPSMQGVLGSFLALPGGREFIVQVPGVMTSPLSDRDVASLMNWLLPEVSAGNLPADFVPYRAEEITHLRLNRPTDVPAQRRRLVEASRTLAQPIPP